MVGRAVYRRREWNALTASPISTVEQWFAARTLGAVRLPARGLVRVSRGRERPDPRRDRHREDLRGLAWGPCSSGCENYLAPAHSRLPPPVPAPPLRVLWITPLRALAADTEAALRAPVEDSDFPGPSSPAPATPAAKVRARQQPAPPDRAGHHAREPLTISDPNRRPDPLRAPRAASWWTSGTSSWPPNAACRPSSRSPGSAASARASDLGTLGDARQHRRGARDAARPRPGRPAAVRAGSCAAWCPRRS